MTPRPVVALLLMVVFRVYARGAQQPPGIDSPAQAGAFGFRESQFIAVSVANLEESSRWYAQAFGLAVLRDLPNPAAGVHTRVLTSRELTVELSEHANAHSLGEYAGTPTPTFLVHGFFKVGFFVGNLDRAVNELKKRGVNTFSDVQTDVALRLRWALFRDNAGNYLQLLEKQERPAQDNESRCIGRCLESRGHARAAAIR